MNKVLLIARRELEAFFNTWMGYIIISAALLINGFLFNTYAIGNQAKFSSEVLKDFFFLSSGIGMVAAVFLSMRLLAEEKQNGTIVLFYTSPITERELILGKFFSALAVFVVLQIISVYIPALIFIEGKVSFGHIISGYLGITLLGSAVIAIAMFGSVVAPNQLIAAVTGASITVVLLLLWLMADKVDEPFSSLFSFMAIHNQRFNPFSKGIVHIKDILYYLSMAIFFIECSIHSLETRRLQG